MSLKVVITFPLEDLRTKLLEKVSLVTKISFKSFYLHRGTVYPGGITPQNFPSTLKQEWLNSKGSMLQIKVMNYYFFYGNTISIVKVLGPQPLWAVLAYQVWYF